MAEQSKTLAHIVGNLGKDPQKKFVESLDKSVVELSVAVTMSYGDEGVTRWVDVAVWNEGLFDAVMGLKKGAKVGVEGTMKVEPPYEEGKKPRYKMSAARIGKWTPFEKVKVEKPKEEDESDSEAEPLTW